MWGFSVGQVIVNPVIIFGPTVDAKDSSEGVYDYFNYTDTKKEVTGISLVFMIAQEGTN